MKHKSQSQLFLEFSVVLTGFSETELRGTGMLERYYNTIVKNTSTEFTDYFFLAVEKALADTTKSETAVEAEIASQFMPISSYGGLSQKIITLWYTGNWDGKVLSADSYIQGLMWDAAHSHPPGAKQPGYGSWANLPLSVTSNTKKATHGKGTV